MEARSFFKALLDRENLNPTSLSRRMAGPGYEPVHQSVMQRFLSGRNITFENAGKLGAALGFNPAALFDPDVADQEARRLGLVKRGATDLDVSDFPSSTVRPYSVRTHNLAPVFAWARLGDVLFTESESLQSGEYREKPDGVGPAFKWFICDADMPRLRIKRGWRVAVDPLTDASICQDGETYLFKTAGGSYFLGDFRRLAVGYEAIPDGGPVMDTERHGITVVAEFAGAMK